VNKVHKTKNTKYNEKVKTMAEVKESNTVKSSKKILKLQTLGRETFLYEK
jgi:hypothetical protein